jgi:hypothetical protein
LAKTLTAVEVGAAALGLGAAEQSEFHVTSSKAAENCS